MAERWMAATAALLDQGLRASLSGQTLPTIRL